LKLPEINKGQTTFHICKVVSPNTLFRSLRAELKFLHANVAGGVCFPAEHAHE